MNNELKGLEDRAELKRINMEIDQLLGPDRLELDEIEREVFIEKLSKLPLYLLEESLEKHARELDEAYEAAINSTLKHLEIIYKETNNPIFVLSAMELIVTDGDCDELKFPHWIRIYLCQTLNRLDDLFECIDFRKRSKLIVESNETNTDVLEPTLEPDQAMSLVPAALRLTKPGWNAISSWQNLNSKLADFDEISELQKRGLTEAKAKADLKKRRGYTDRSAFRRRLAEAARIRKAKGGQT